MLGRAEGKGRSLQGQTGFSLRARGEPPGGRSVPGMKLWREAGKEATLFLLGLGLVVTVGQGEWLGG